MYPMRPLGDALSLDPLMVSLSPDSPYPVTGIYSFGRGLIKRPSILGSETAYEKMARIRTGQLVISKLNAWEGALAVVTSDFSDTYVSPEYPVFSISKEAADPGYIKHLVAWPALWELLTPRGSMVRRKRTTPATFLATKVPLPDLNEQRRIAAKLDAATSRLTAVASLRDKAKDLRLALYDSILGQVATRKPLSEGISLDLDEVPVLAEKTYDIAGVYGFGRGLIDRGPLVGAETKYQKFNRLRSGNLIMSRLKAFEGALAVVPKRFEGHFASPEFPTFALIEGEMETNYLNHLCQWPRLWSLLSQESKGVGARRERVTSARLLATEVPFPGIEEQQSIASQLDRVQATSSHGKQQEQHFDALRLALLNAAFTGQL